MRPKTLNNNFWKKKYLNQSYLFYIEYNVGWKLSSAKIKKKNNIKNVQMSRYLMPSIKRVNIKRQGDVLRITKLFNIEIFAFVIDWNGREFSAFINKNMCRYVTRE